MKSEWVWNNTYQKLYKRAKSLIKEACMAFHNEEEQIYLEAYLLGISLRASLLQMRDGMEFPKDIEPHDIVLKQITLTSESLASVETQYSNIKIEALDIFHSIEKFDYYFFMKSV